MRKIAIIPARSGSKRIPKKNIKTFCGKPILAYAIEVAIESGLYDEVIVSTDSEEIAKVAIEHGAKIPFLRSQQNSNDFATTVDALLEVFEWYKKKDVYFDYATCIYACSPFIKTKLLTESFETLLTKKCDCVFPVLAYSHPIQRALGLLENGKVIQFDNSNADTRTQDLNRSFHDAGMFYTFDVTKLLVNKSLRTENTCAIEISELQAHDIDNENDWILAEMKYKLFFK